ncbi:MAG: hypothetical protein COA78_26130 [Blastopirellula sp.]|nr:MAG: hypothetical protein COA78_26130 [Blastopirellula sp.]
MSAIDSVEEINVSATEPEASSSSDFWKKTDVFLENCSEYLNPILVKETRQALKSKQFVITFSLVLIAAWGWSMLGIAMYSPGIAYSPAGASLLHIYLDILLFPLVLIIPFSAFRSLASEQEDGTYELLSISTLKPEQIIRGKLGSAILQSMVYFSALAPCIGFTYLLRGIDIITISILLLIVFLLTCILSVTGLLLATVTRSKQWQSVLSVVVVLLFAFCYFFTVWMSLFMNTIDTSWQAYDQEEFWFILAAIISAYVSYFLLIFYAATAQITFASENRSSKLRAVMLVQHFLILGWMFYIWVYSNFDAPALMFAAGMLTVHWAIMGALMNGEQSTLSPRVRRSIPDTLVGRISLNWFLPGPARGYFYAISGIIGGGLSVVLIQLCAELAGLDHWYGIEQMFWFTFTMSAYAIIYLGMGRLIMMALRKYFFADVFLSFLIHILLIMIGSFAPLILHLSIPSISNYDYSLIEMPNPFWSITEFFGRGSLSYNYQFIVLQFFLITGTAFMLLLQIVVSAKDLVPEKVAVPSRVLEEDALLMPVEEPVSDDPWDQE